MVSCYIDTIAKILLQPKLCRAKFLTDDIQAIVKYILQCFFKTRDKTVIVLKKGQEIRSDLVLAINVYTPDANFH